MPRNIEQERTFFALLGQGSSIRAAARGVGLTPSSGHRLATRGEMPFGPMQSSENVKVPPVAWTSDQPPPAPAEYQFQPGYHDHTFRSFFAPIAFEGFTLDRIRNAIALHRNGLFYESSLLAYSALSFGPVFAATVQRMSPLLALARKVSGGTRGLSRILKEEITAEVAPEHGHASSIYVPPTLWGAMDFDLTWFGFSVVQHVDGPADEETGIRKRYTRRWPTWAVQYYRWRKTFVAITTNGPVDICGDGKFTLVADVEDPHLLGAVIAIGEEALDGKFTQRARASYIQKYGNPKWIGEMPPGVAVKSPEGQALFEALKTLRNPDGTGVIPNGAKYTIEGLVSGQSTTFKDALQSNMQFIAAILLGSDGTLTSGTGGVYTSPTFEGVARRLIARNARAIVIAMNSGHIIPYCTGNYGASDFDMPMVDIPLPDPEADARRKSYQERVAALSSIILAERANGFAITQARVDQLATALDVEAPEITGIAISTEDATKAITVDEVRKAQGLPPIGDDRGKLLMSQLNAPAGASETTANAGENDPANAPPPEPVNNK